MSDFGSTGGLSNASTALSQGASGVGGNSFGFAMPTGFSAGGSPSMAGLSGIQSGMSLPTQAAGTNSFGFTMPDPMDMASKLTSSLGGAAKAMSTPSPDSMGVGAHGGAVGLRSQSFSAPIADFVSAPGSVGGNGLLQMLMKYRAGQAG
ncbi:hypothetical protein [Burkholderia cenocepacia]|uniref:hypothetical protein n=1 Tax=Burkholderia cenocepacia TaxID=95486 RepID=UPI002231A106|nr:hypothetical protein [Burkholderia cenocepacia]